MKKVKFVFCVHNHQPVGNFDFVFEKAYQDAYKPFLDVLALHPKIKIGFHASGMIWQYLSDQHPNYIIKIKKLIKSGNIEILSGGYFEPILCAIPDRDKIAQINKMTNFLKSELDCKEINGMWLAERIWEPNFAKILNQCGIKYTILDDTHFFASGVDPKSLHGYYTTEDEGFCLNIFPISKDLRYLIPFQNVEKTIEYFKSLAINANDKSPIAVMADDGEKFGLWPGTNNLVYKEKWLDKFFDAIEKADEFVETDTFSNILKEIKPEARVYLPCASYFEMSQWSLCVNSQEKFDDVVKKYSSDNDVAPFLRGGFWRNFLSKYDEANNIHKKMLHVSKKVEEYSKKKSRHLSEVCDNLYAGQCNCAYWHGVFGGLYLPHLRNALYSSLLKAEGLYNKYFLKNEKWNISDFNCDRQDEYLYESKLQNIYISPGQGGSIFEWDIFKLNHNFLNVFTRRYEAYHKKLKENILNAVSFDDGNQKVQTIHNETIKVKEAGLDKFLIYDKTTLASLQDSFLNMDINFENFVSSSYEEKGDFINKQYDVKIASKKLMLRRKAKAYGKDIELLKIIEPVKSGYNVEYEIKNLSEYDLNICFSPKQVFAFSSKIEDDFANLKDIQLWKRFDEFLKCEVEIKFAQKCDAFVYPIETISASENGYEKTYQGTAFSPLFKFRIDKDKTEKIKFSVMVNI